jgi:hypothetical protein
VTVLTAIREVQIPLIAALMLGACSTKMVRALRTWSVDDALGPTALFPLRLQKPLALIFCGIECGLGTGLILTAGRIGHGAPADCIRLGAGLMFTVATCALLELRATRPDVGCGCFGDFSTAPVSGRTLARSALLAAAALSTLGLPAISQPKLGAETTTLLVIMVIELIVLGALSPELSEALVRLGYSEPCELRAVPAERTLAALRRSKHWRRYGRIIISDAPTDIWRELCWRYVVFPAQYQGRSTDVIFAVFLQQHRPAIHVALVDVGTGERVPWPPGPPRAGDPARKPAPRLAPGLATGVLATAPSGAAQTDMRFSSDL